MASERTPACILRFHLIGLKSLFFLPLTTKSVYGEEPPEVIVGAVEDVERVLLIWNDIHRFRIVLSGRRDMEERRNPGLNIIQCMKLDSAFLLPEHSPFEDAEAQVNRGGVKGIYLASEPECLDSPALLGFCHNTIGELLEDAAVLVNVRF